MIDAIGRAALTIPPRLPQVKREHVGRFALA